MEGRQFENFVGILYLLLGYEVEFTPASADQGADLILVKDGIRTAVQVKRWRSSVGNSAVQEAISAKVFYKCKRGIIVTNSTFTRSARTLALKDTSLKLIDGEKLRGLCNLYCGDVMPPFSVDEWARLGVISGFARAA
jgi:HJR/Mrr/RecB family endonuclease